MAYLNNEMVTNALNGQPVHEILNAIRDEASDYYRRSVVEASFGNIQATGLGINSNPALQNEFLTALVTHVFSIAMSSPKLKNDFEWARGQKIPYGKTLQEVATDVIEPIQFDQYASEFTEKEIFKPTVATRFYTMNREDQFPISISRVLLMSAFDSDSSFMQFMRDQLQVLFASDERAKYKYTIALLENYYKQNKFFVVPADDVLSGSSTAAENFIELVSEHTMNMTIGAGTRVYNNQGFVERTDMSQLHLFITTKLLARLKIGYWAKVFNLTEAELKPNVHVVDSFGDTTDIQAIIVDRDFFRIHPNYVEMSEARNNRGLYSTFYYTVLETYACSDFKNALVITSKSPSVPVYDVVIPLSSADVRRGGSLTYNAIVRQTDDKTYTPVFTVEKPEGGQTLATKTKFNGATLTIDSDEKNTELVIKATVTVGTGETASTVIGRAMVKVVK